MCWSGHPILLTSIPIEHVWAELKRLVYQLHPELYTAEGLEDVMMEKIKSTVYEAWEQISNKFFYSLINSMHEPVRQ